MPLPLAPVVGIALRYGAVALIGAAITKSRLKTISHKDLQRESIWNTVPDGAKFERFEGEGEVQLAGTHGHWQRIWLGSRGIEFDSRILARFRIRKLVKGDSE